MSNSHFAKETIVRLSALFDVPVAPASLSFSARGSATLGYDPLSTTIHRLLPPFTAANISRKASGMPSSITSLHPRTATISSSSLSSTFSSIRTPSLRGHGSAAGSLSTISSGPFVHADALDTTILWIPSYYLDDSTRLESTIRAPRPNAVIAHTPTSSIFSNKVNLLPHGLMRLIRTSDLAQSVKDMLLAMVRMVVHISQQLFPPSHILRDDVARDVENIALDICDFLDLIIEKLEQRLDTASSAKDQLVNNDLEGEIALEEVVRWVDIIE
jgi:hypothetical protein